MGTLSLPFQSTPAGGDAAPSRPTGSHSVSIHAPARGATQFRHARGDLIAGFNPRPRAGGDSRKRSSPARCSSFNPRPRAGGDSSGTSASSSPACFNPRPRAGGDITLSTWPGRSQMFQSTPPRACRARSSSFNPRPRAGGDLLMTVHASMFPGFNPRPRAGGDAGGEAGAHFVDVSIHAPARGATQVERQGRILLMFQSTPPRGGRLSNSGRA